MDTLVCRKVTGEVVAEVTVWLSEARIRRLIDEVGWDFLNEYLEEAVEAREKFLAREVT